MYNLRILKSILTTLTLLLVSGMLLAQEIVIESQNVMTAGKRGSEVSSPIVIYNNSDVPLHLSVRLTDQALAADEYSYFCLGDQCFDPGTTELLDFIEVAPGAKFEAFSAVIKSGISDGQSTLTYTFFDAHQPQIAEEVTLSYFISDQIPKPLLYHDQSIELVDIYPNPAVDYLQIAYNVLNPNLQAKGVIHNVLGTSEYEFDINPFENQTQINVGSLRSGVYFFTLYRDNENVLTQKIIIRH